MRRLPDLIPFLAISEVVVSVPLGTADDHLFMISVILVDAIYRMGINREIACGHTHDLLAVQLGPPALVLAADTKTSLRMPRRVVAAGVPCLSGRLLARREVRIVAGMRRCRELDVRQAPAEVPCR